MGDKKYIVYKEYMGSTPDDYIVNTLKIAGDSCAELIKNNIKQTRMIFEKNRRNHCLYHTEFGTMTFGVFTSEIEFGGDEKGGNLKLKYTLDMNSTLISKNELDIKFKRIEE